MVFLERELAVVLGPDRLDVVGLADREVRLVLRIECSKRLTRLRVGVPLEDGLGALRQVQGRTVATRVGRMVGHRAGISGGEQFMGLGGAVSAGTARSGDSSGSVMAL